MSTKKFLGVALVAATGLVPPGGGVTATVPETPATYTSTTFAIPFEVAVPDWLAPEPTVERPNFVTWESSEPDRAFRFLAPVRVIQPPDATDTDVPDDYVDYLLSLSEFGATFEDVVETTIDGNPATIVTTTAANTIDAAYGCEEPQAGECWGPIPDAVLRMAVIEVGDQVLLVWQRDPIDAEGLDYAEFDSMLASLHFHEGATPATEQAADTTTEVTAASTGSAPATDVIPDGTYTKLATRENGEALGMEPELLDAIFGSDGEVPIELEIEGDRWRQYSINDAGIREIGDQGTSTYDGEGRWVTVSESTGCPGCTGVAQWTFDDGELTLTLVPPANLPDDWNIVRLVVEGVYQRDQDTDAIPEGLYSRVATRAEGETLGLDDEVMDAMGVGADEWPVEIEIADDRWTYYVTSDAGIREIGTGGTFGYDDAGHWIVYEDCCDSTTTLDWALAEGELALRLVDFEDPSADPALGLPIIRFVMEGDYQLVPADEPVAAAAPTVTLRFANPGDGASPPLVAFVEEVQRLSEGTIEFEWLPNYGIDPTPEGGYPNAEATIVSDLADSTVDIGWVGTRALPGFEALLAPLLVDSHDLQQEVFDAGIVARMLADLGDDGLVGITVLPGPLRRLAGVEHPFATTDDFNGATVAGEFNDLTRAAMSALGATEIQGASGLPVDAADAIVAHFAAISGNGYHNQADSVVANLNLWPRPLAIVMSAESFASMSPQQQDALLTAGADAIGPAMEAARGEDLDGGAQVCAGTIEVIEASDADLADIEAALEPVYADLESDPRTAAYLDEIRALKDELGAPPDTLTCPAP